MTEDKCTRRAALYSTLLGCIEPIVRPYIAAVRRVEQFLGPDDDWVEGYRKTAYTHLHGTLRGIGGYATVSVQPRPSVGVYSGTPDECEQSLHAHGFQRNTLAARKYRTVDGERQWATGSWVYFYETDSDHQYHVTLFAGPNGHTDVYGHKEERVADVDSHIESEDIIHGDPDHILGDVDGLTYT